MARFWLRMILAGLAVLPMTVHAQVQSETSIRQMSADRLVEVAQEESERGNHETALSFYVRAIAREPNDPQILTAAGDEALSIADYDAAIGFYGRAVTLKPRNAHARAGYGRALVNTGRPKDALALFDQVTRLGMAEAEIAGDRGLARDLLGENRRAQNDYRLALAKDPANPELIQRLGLSLAISGDREAAIALVQPLTRRGGSGAAFRTLAFVHALTGDVGTARKLAMANMGSEQAEAFTPFFARISLMSAEEKANAVHLGRLPQVRLAQNERTVPKRVKLPDGDPVAMRAAANGDTPPVIEKEPRRVNKAEPKPEPKPVRASAKADAEEAKSEIAAKAETKSNAVSIIQECASLKGGNKVRCEADARALERRCTNAKGRPTGECKAYEVRLAELKDTSGKAKAERKDSAIARADVPAPKAVSALDECDGLTGSKLVQCRADARALERRCGGAKPQKTGECRAYATRMAERKDATEKPRTERTEKSAPSRKDREELAEKPAAASVGDECAGLTGSKQVQCRANARALERRCGGANPQKTAECKAYADRKEEASASTPAAKGKNAKADTAAKDDARPKAKGKSAERYWVQVASGKNKTDLPKAWAGVKTKASSLLGKRTPYTAPVGASNRLLVGPFDSASDARDFVNKLKAAGLSTFPWTSDAGENVDRLDTK